MAHDLNAPAEEGNTGWAGEARLNAGRNFTLSGIPFLGSVPGFLDAEVAYRVRTKGPPDEWHGDLTVGFRVHAQDHADAAGVHNGVDVDERPDVPSSRQLVEGSVVYALNDKWSI